MLQVIRKLACGNRSKDLCTFILFILLHFIYIYPFLFLHFMFNFVCKNLINKSQINEKTTNYIGFFIKYFVSSSLTSWPRPVLR